MKTFLRSFYLSLTDPSYYGDILEARTKFAVKYYILLALALTAVTTAAGIINHAPSIRRDFTQVAQEIIQNFPPDLVLEVKPTGIIANKPFPLVAQTPTAFVKNQPASLPKNLLVIDPQGQVDMLDDYESLALLNNSYLIVRDRDTVQTAPLKDFPGLRIDADFMRQLSGAASFIATNAFWVTGLAFVISGLADFFVVKLLYLFFFALVLRLFNKALFATFGDAFKTGVHSFTLPMLISATSKIADIEVPLPGWIVIIHTIFVLYVASKLEKPFRTPS